MHLTTLLKELETRFGAPAIQRDGYTTYRWTIPSGRPPREVPSPATHLVVTTDEAIARAVVFVFDPTKPPYELRVNTTDDPDLILRKVDDLLLGAKQPADAD